MSRKKHSTFRRAAKGAATTALIALLVPAVSLGQGMSVSAATVGSAAKQETVYVNADATGAVKQETVSVWLHDDTPGAVVADRSALTGITNLKGDEKPSISGDSVTWKLNGSDLYYQGKTTKTLPVSFSVRYFLDGKETAPAALPGKSGKFEMKISFTNNDAHQATVDGKTVTVYTPFLCAAAFDLSKDHFANVATNFGNVVSDGSNQLVSYLSVPGLKESFGMLDLSSLNLPDELDVTADVTDFSLGPVMMLVSPMPDLSSLKSSDALGNLGDISALGDKLNALIDAGSQLKTATGTLSSGEQAFADGVSQLLSGVGTAGSSFDKIVSGANTLSSSASNSSKGLPALVSGANSLSSGASQVSGGLDKLLAQFGAGTNGSSTLSDGIGSLNTGAQQVSGGLGQLLAQFSPSKTGDSATLYDSVNALSTGAAQYTSLTNNTLFALTETSLQTIQNAIASVLTPALKQQGMSDAQIAATVQKTVGQIVAQELTTLHGAADAAVLETLTATDETSKAAYLNEATEYINLYDIFSVITSDPAVSAAADASKKEAAFEQQMKTAAAAPAASLYSFNKDALPITLAALSLGDQQKAALEQAAAALPAANITALVNTVGAQNIVLAGDSLANGTAALAAQFKTAVSGQSATLYDSVAALYGGAQQVAGGTKSLWAQTRAGTDAANPTLYDSVKALDTGANSLTAGAKTLAAGAAGLKAMQSGIGTLANGLALFEKGLGTIQNGTSLLYTNSKKLSSGASALDSGMNEFWSEGISKLRNIDTDKLKEAVGVKDELVKLAENYNTFTGTGDGISSSVKFIVKTDEIKAGGSVAQAASSAAEKAPSLWQRIVNWFKSLFHR